MPSGRTISAERDSVGTVRRSYRRTRPSPGRGMLSRSTSTSLPERRARMRTSSCPHAGCSRQNPASGAHSRESATGTPSGAANGGSGTSHASARVIFVYDEIPNLVVQLPKFFLVLVLWANWRTISFPRIDNLAPIAVLVSLNARTTIVFSVCHNVYNARKWVNRHKPNDLFNLFLCFSYCHSLTCLIVFCCKDKKKNWVNQIG